MDFCHLQYISAKTASKKTIYETAEKIAKPKPQSNTNSRNVEEIVIPPETKYKTQNELRQVL